MIYMMYNALCEYKNAEGNYQLPYIIIIPLYWILYSASLIHIYIHVYIYLYLYMYLCVKSCFPKRNKRYLKENALAMPVPSL